MYIFIGQLGSFYKLNSNCPDSEKIGSGPWSCGGKLNLEQMLSKAKLPTKERLVSSKYSPQSTVENTVKESAKFGIKIVLPYDANYDEINNNNNIVKNIVWYRENFPDLHTNTVISQDLGRSYARSGNNNGIIYINRRFARNTKETKKRLKDDVISKFHPVGCDTMQAMVDHEIGHQLDKKFGISKTKEFIQIIGGLTSSDVSNELSRYAASDPINEIISEAWSEYKNNLNPRPIAKAIGELIMSKARK